MAEMTPKTFGLKERQLNYIRRMTEKYDLPDEGKTVRILIDFAMHETEEEERIFTVMRCSGC